MIKKKNIYKIEDQGRVLQKLCTHWDQLGLNATKWVGDYSGIIIWNLEVIVPVKL
jgi:hypothetical protein